MLQQLLFVSAKKFMSRTFLNVHLVTVNLKKSSKPQKNFYSFPLRKQWKFFSNIFGRSLSWQNGVIGAKKILRKNYFDIWNRPRPFLSDIVLQRRSQHRVGFKKTKHVLSLGDLVERVMNKQRLICLNIAVAQCEDANLSLNRWSFDW
jgi:hypothetical protein